MKLVAATLGGLAVAAVVLYGFATSDSRIERASGAVIDTFARDPQNAGPISQVSPLSGAEYGPAWFNVHVVTGALHRSAALLDPRTERASGAVIDTFARDPRNAGPIRLAASLSGAEYRCMWFNVH